MSEEKFTPGPWVAYPHLRRRNHTEISTDEPPVISVASVYGVKNQKMANALLIAAAPELYKELEKHCSLCVMRHPEREKCKLCETRKVLRKARGEE